MSQPRCFIPKLCLFLLILQLILPAITAAQGEPAVRFQREAAWVSSSWDEETVSDNGTRVCRSERQGTVSGNTLTLHGEAKAVGYTSLAGQSCAPAATHNITVYAKGRPSITITTSSSGTASLDPDGWAHVDLPRTSTNDITLSGGGTASGTASETKHFNLSCSSTAAADFDGAAYPDGVLYSRPVGFAPVSAVAQVSTQTSTFDLSASVDATISVTIGSSSPVAILTGPTVGGVTKVEPQLGDSVTLTNISYDPDDETGSTALEGICGAAWTVTFPDGSVQIGSNLGSHTFTPTMAGNYAMHMVVTDNEGMTASDDKEFAVQPASIGPDKCPDDASENYCSGPGGALACANVSPRSGNYHIWVRDPVSTRGFPLMTNIHLNGQTNFPARATAMGNATFTYGIAVIEGTITVNGSTSTHWYVLDADGSEIDYGLNTSAPAAQPGAYATLSVISGGFTLTNAGPPESVEAGGNFSYEFDGNGKLITFSDPSNNVQEIAYDTGGYPISVTDISTGKSITFEYDDPGNIARVVEGGGEAVIHLSYDSGKLIEIAFKDQLATVLREIDLTYGTGGRLATVQYDNDSSAILTFTHQHAGKGIYRSNLSYTGGGTNYNYFSLPGTGYKYRTKETTAQGGVILYDYDANQDLVKVTLPTLYGAAAAYSYTYTRDSWRNVTIYKYGSSATDRYVYTYDSLGKITNIFNDWSTVNRTFTYSGFDLLTAADPLGTYLTNTYTDTGNPHSPTTTKDGLNRTWTQAYNSCGQVITITPPSGSPQGQTTYAYEETSTDPAFGYLRSITNGAGDVETYDSYSALGDALEISTTPVSGTTNTTTYSYDAVRRLTVIEHPDTKTFSLAYSGRNLSSTVDEAGSSRDFAWTPTTGELAGISEPLSRELAWTYDADRKLSDFTDARTNTTDYTYGSAGELKFVTYPDSSQIEYKYDTRARLSSKTSPRGRVMTAAYDGENRFKSWTFSNPTQTAVNFYYRNQDGRITSTQSWTGTATYTYTAARQVDTVTYNYQNSGLTALQKLTYTYNPDGSVATLNWKTGTTNVVTWTYSYDSAGRLSGVSNTFGESSSYTYDGEGKIKTQTNGNSTTVDYAYNQARGWPTSIVHKLSGTAFASYDLEYDGGSNTVGNITKVTELDSSEVNYQYDELYRLTSETRTGTNAFTHTYNYDLAGNVTDLDGSAFATYDTSNKFSSLSGGTYSYDTSGNLTAVSGAGLSSGTFNYETRELLDNQTQGSTSIGYNYDAYGKRLLSKPGTTASTYTWYIFDGDRLIGEIGTSGVKAVYTWGTDGLVSERIISGNKSRYYHFGPQGETREVTNTSGAVTNSYYYTGYGTMVASSGSDYNPHQFGGKVGYYREGPMGLMLATYRWYSPNLMRWMTRDPIKYKGGSNLYEYVDGRVTQYLDPSGLAPGDYYPNRDGAANAGIGDSWPPSERDGVEYGGSICKLPCGGYTYTTPRTDGEKENVHVPSICPDGTPLQGMYHTHPINYNGSQNLSGRDVLNSRRYKVPIYVGSHDKYIHKFDPAGNGGKGKWSNDDPK
jgi:RHS repeat-associated protein